MDISYIKAYENYSPLGNATINYELHMLSDMSPPHEYVDKVYVEYGKSSVVVDLKNFNLLNNGVVVTQVKTHDIEVTHHKLDGFSEIVFLGKNGKSRFKVKFSSRDKSFRVVENTLGTTTATGVMVNRTEVQVPRLEYSQGV